MASSNGVSKRVTHSFALFELVHLCFSLVFLAWGGLPLWLLLRPNCRCWALRPMVTAQDVITGAFAFVSALRWHEQILLHSSARGKSLEKNPWKPAGEGAGWNIPIRNRDVCSPEWLAPGLLWGCV
jgi:hypothetical protein